MNVQIFVKPETVQDDSQSVAYCSATANRPGAESFRTTPCSQVGDVFVRWTTPSSQTYVHVVSFDYSEFLNIRSRSVIRLLRVLKSAGRSFSGELRVLKHTTKAKFLALDHGLSHGDDVDF
jgi:hypothetical protein